MAQPSLFDDPAEAASRAASREAEGCEYIANGWRVSAIHARRDGFPEAAERYDAEAERWAQMAAEHRALAAQGDVGSANPKPEGESA